MTRRYQRIPAAAALAVSMAALTACGGAGGPYGAPVVERSTASAEAPSTGETDASPAAPGGDASPTSDWEATARPLGESGKTSSRRLGDVAVPAAPAEQEVDTGASAAAAEAAPGEASDANPAVVSLLNAATAKTREGDYAGAAATLERALNIEPDNPWLWHRLADVRLREGALDQAANLASKSNSLAVGDARLQADNWKLIAEARRRQGATAAAATAEAQAASLMRSQ